MEGWDPKDQYLDVSQMLDQDQLGILVCGLEIHTADGTNGTLPRGRHVDMLFRAAICPVHAFRSYVHPSLLDLCLNVLISIRVTAMLGLGTTTRLGKGMQHFAPRLPLKLSTCMRWKVITVSTVSCDLMVSQIMA